MPIFRYRAIDEQGIRREGTLERDNTTDVEAYLRVMGYAALDITRLHFWNTDLRTLLQKYTAFNKKTASKKELAVFCRQMSFVLEAGVSIKSAVSLLASQSVNRAMQNSLLAIHDRIVNGESLTHSMEAVNIFPPFICSMCRIGEMTASLPQVMTQLADYYEQSTHTDSEMKSALAYPAVVTLMMLAVIIIAVTFVVPNYAMVFASTGVTLPLLTRVLMQISDFLITYGNILLAGVIAAALTAALFANAKTGQVWIARIQLYAPVIRTLYRQTVNLRFAQAMSLMLMSGQSLVSAIPVVMGVIDNICVQDDLQRLSAGLEEGGAFWMLLARIPYMDPLLVSMAQIGEETGKLPYTITKCRSYFQNENEAAIRRLSKLVEPAITIVLGMILGLIMLAVMLPTFALTNAF